MLKYRLISRSIAEQLTDEERRRLLRAGWLYPIGGSEDNDDDDNSAGGSGGDEDDEENDDDVLEVSRANYNELVKFRRKFEAAEKKAQEAEAKAREKAQKEAGEYEELLREKDETIAALQGERDGVMHEFDQYKRSALVEKQAAAFGFKDPADALANMSPEDTEDENSVLRALRRISRAKPYLVDPRKASAAPISGDGGSSSGGLTMEMIKNMSTEEIQARLDEVQEVMAASGNNAGVIGRL